MGAALPVFAAVAGGLQVAGGVVNAMGQKQAGDAARASANYNAAVARANADQAKSNAQLTSQAGMIKEGMSQQQTRAEFGNTIANQAGSGINVNQGSAVDVQASTAELGQLDAMTIRSNATKEAYGYEVDEGNYKAKATLDEFEGKQAHQAGELAALGTILGTASGGASSYQKYKMSGSL